MKYLIEVTSAPDREELVAEIWSEANMIAEINQENKELEVEIYFNEYKEPLSLNYEAFLQALKEAKQKLIG